MGGFDFDLDFDLGKGRGGEGIEGGDGLGDFLYVGFFFSFL